MGSFSAAIRCHLGLKSFKDLTELWFCKEIPRSVLRVKEHHGFNLIQFKMSPLTDLENELTVVGGGDGEKGWDGLVHTAVF